MARAIDGTKATKEVMEYSRKLHEAGNVDAAGYVMWAASIVDKQPTIDPVKHGNWIKKYGTWYCSECDKIGYKGYIPVKPSDYCPNCGARMDGETNETKTS